MLDTKSSPAVQAHINMLQCVINRLANNSANCKTWSITILSAILVLLFDKKIDIIDVRVAYIPIVLFYFLDCYYLGLERQIIKKQANFVYKINTGGDFAEDIFKVKGNKPVGICDNLERLRRQISNTAGALFSFSTSPFYISLILLIYYLES